MGKVTPSLKYTQASIIVAKVVIHYKLYVHHRYGFSAAISVYQGFGYSCNGNEESLSQCSTSGSICRADNADYAVAIECSGALSKL